MLKVQDKTKQKLQLNTCFEINNRRLPSFYLAIQKLIFCESLNILRDIFLESPKIIYLLFIYYFPFFMATKLYFLFLEAFSDVTVSFTERRKTMKLRQETQKSSIICEEMSITMSVYLFGDSKKEHLILC